MGKAEEVLQDAIDKGVTGQLAARIHFELAVIQAMDKKYDMAFDHLKMAIEIDPGFVEVAKKDYRLKRVISQPKFKQLLDSVKPAAQ